MHIPAEPDEIAVSNRRYDIDWIRVIAIGILLVFHIMVMYQSYANKIKFIQSPVLLESLMIPLSLSAVIRIPLLFFVSGMGVFFSLQRRTWLKLVGERAKRILLPLLFGIFAIVPIHHYLYARFYDEQFEYPFDAGHLWFLMNLFMYVLWFIAVFYFVKEITNSRFFDSLRRMLARYPATIYIIVSPYILESLSIPSDLPYALFFDSRVGLLLGGVAFLLGFAMVALGKVVWEAITKIKLYALGLAIGLYVIRLMVFEGHGPHIVTATESISWILTVFGFAYRHLNQPSRVLGYLSSVAYPVYIVHMAFMYLGAYFFFPMNLNPWVSFVVITLVTFAGSILMVEMIRRIPYVRLLFGMKSR